MTFLIPEFLWLLPAALLLPWFVPKRATSAQHALLRTLALTALVFALARPVAVYTSRTEHHVVVVDRSPSAPGGEAARAVAQVRDAMPDDARAVLVTVGASGDAAPEGFDRVIALDAAGRSPLGDGLAHALAAIPVGEAGSITLISDGLATDDGWRVALSDTSARGLPVHTVALRPTDAARLRAVAVQPIGELRVGHLGRVRVAVAGVTRDARVHLFADDEEVAASSPFANPSAADVVEVELTFEPRRPGFVALRAELEASVATAPALQREVAVQEPLRVLYLGGRVQGAAGHLGQLLGEGFVVQEHSGLAAPDLSRVDVTVLDDRPAAQLPEPWQQAIADAVQQRGMGLFVSGGRAAFGPGGYHDTVIEQLTPVEYVQKEEKKDPSTTLAVVIDTSGSMVGNRMTLAKEVARLAVRRLQPHDKVGIVEFYGTKQWAAPIQSAANSIDLQRALNRLGASGGTVLFPAIEECYYALKNVQTRYKHVLVITDAGVETGPYEALLRKMSDEGIAVSTVLVGPGRHSEFLVELADWGGGRYYHSPDRFNLPELLLKKPNTSMLPAYRPGNYVVEARGGRGWWGDVDPSKVPPVRSLVETAPRPGADVLLSVASTGRPVLASWRHGLGRVTAMTTEPVGPGTQGWRDWAGYGPAMARLLSRTARSAQPPYSFVLDRRDGRLFVEARREVRAAVGVTIRTAGDGSAGDGAEGAAADVSLREVAPGVFRGAVDAADDDVVRLLATAGDGNAHRLCSDALDARSPETNVDPRAALPLVDVAAASGGVHVAASAAMPAFAAGAASQPLDTALVWPWFALLALLAYVMDVYWRRRAPRTGGTV